MISPVLHKKYRNYHYCAVKECKNTSIKTPNKLWVRLPTDINMRNNWLKLAKRDPSSLSVESRLFFCEDHFDLPNDMENYLQYKLMGSVPQIRLKPGSVPKKFECQIKKTPTYDMKKPYLRNKEKLMLLEKIRKEQESMVKKSLDGNASERSGFVMPNKVSEISRPECLPKVRYEAKTLGEQIRDSRPRVKALKDIASEAPHKIETPVQIVYVPIVLVVPPKEMLEVTVPSMHTEAAVDVMIKEEPIDIHMETVGALRGTDACVKKETVHHEGDGSVIPESNLQGAQSECINDIECHIDRKIQTHKTVEQQYRCEEQKVLLEECKRFEESNTVTEDCNEITSVNSASILKKVTRFRNQEVDDIPKVGAKTAVERMRAYRARRREIAGADRRYGDPDLERRAKTAAERMRAYRERKRVLNNGTVERLNDISHSLEDRVVPKGVNIRKSTEFNINGQYGHVGSTNGEHPPHINEATPLVEPPKEMVVTVPSMHTEGTVDVMINEEHFNNNVLTKKVARTSTERVREYRTRIRSLENTRIIPPSDTESIESQKILEYKVLPVKHSVTRKPKTPTERVQAFRERKRALKNVNERLIGTNRSHNRN